MNFANSTGSNYSSNYVFDFDPSTVNFQPGFSPQQPHFISDPLAFDENCPPGPATSDAPQHPNFIHRSPQRDSRYTYPVNSMATPPEAVPGFAAQMAEYRTQQLARALTEPSQHANINSHVRFDPVEFLEQEQRQYQADSEDDDLLGTEELLQRKPAQGGRAGHNASTFKSGATTTPVSKKSEMGVAASNNPKTAEPEASTPARAQGRKTPRTRGRGARSGAANRRIQGASDEEIARLSPEAKQAAQLKSTGLTEEEKLKTVEFITQPERWKTFRLSQAHIFQHLADVVFKKRVKPTQVSNYWHGQAWDKYKACQENLVRHTGGGDGDDDWFSSEDSDCLLGSETDPDDEDGQGRAFVRYSLKKDITGTHSRKKLVEFMHSEVYRLIHKVAHKDQSVTREEAFHSKHELSDTDDLRARLGKRRREKKLDTDKHDSIIESALSTISKRAKVQEEMQRAQLELEKARAAREEEEHRERERIRQMELLHARRKLRLEERTQAMDLLRHPDPEVVAEGRRLLQKLREEEEVDKLKV
ncbi:hypothetical protein L226DRAFT_610608 [Lentinus tigrinus ALCF2SS1-7]|uniref:Uncharacterized protein n=1 Tax=Lentinus tigrinus ALCF2SS1-6 TaxID=1328759 RepID=A0A5C2S203_9APHY|nr:hypothetical protein L227DRAFT_577863 [Lentinus tigrinus ALCF2SS1-6]RPD78769.1 hypothetical protein L226DRAFT_610608 [Lentinus tigrinus ALCF2SS1-7]